MSEQIRLYQNDKVRIIPLERKKGFSLGEDAQCDVHLDKDVCKGRAISFQYENGNWTVSCKGQIWLYGEEIRTPRQTAHMGDMYVLDGAGNLAVEISQIAQHPAGRVPLDGLHELRIGRKEGNELRLADPRMSNRHARLYEIGSEWHICDPGSTNGTYVGGKRIKDVPLHEGDWILMGATELIYRDGDLEIYADPRIIHLQLPETAAAEVEYPYFTRSPRLSYEAPATKVEIEAAPSIGSRPEINWLSVILPSVGTTVLMLAISILTGLNPMSLAFTAPMMLISVIVSIFNYRGQIKRYRESEDLLQKRYHEYLDAKEEEIVQLAAQQRNAALDVHPTLSQCVARASAVDRRLWERDVTDADYLSLRVGIGTAPLRAEIKTPKVNFQLQEGPYTREPEQLADQYCTVDQMPIACDLMRHPSLGITGKREQVIHAVHALVVQAATHHSYDDLRIVVLYPGSERRSWEWMRWLPHVWNADRTHRYMSATTYEAAGMLAELETEYKKRAAAGSSYSGKEQPVQPWYLWIIADPALLSGQPVADYLLQQDSRMGIASIYLGNALGDLPRNVTQILDVHGNQGTLYMPEHALERSELELDGLSLEACERFARALAPIRLPERDSAQLLPESVTFLEGWHVRRPDELDLSEFWANTCNYKSMSVPIGVRANGENFYFDIHEKAHGPHGLVAGMTGSGKSEMVQSWILSMALQFSPRDVSFVLIDFKGTGLIQPFLNLPHLAGTISDLDTNISRNLIALQSELQRRKSLFDQAGVNNITNYLKLYHARKVREPLPYLFVVIDEYAEFKAQFPEFTSEVNSLFRTGRSMGVHIILLTQNPSGVVSGESENNVRFRWCLKVASAAASKEVLGGHDEAARITHPGRAYVRVGTDEVYEPVQSFYSGAPYRPDKDADHSEHRTIAGVPVSGERVPYSPEGNQTPQNTHGSEIDAVVRYIHDYVAHSGMQGARHIWQNRMPARVLLSDLLRGIKQHEPGELRPIVGLLDDPAAQSQRPLRLPLSEDGHVAVYGAPGTGKTVFLQTLAASLCMEYTLDEVNLYIMDYGSRTLGMFRDYPHVAAVANDNDEELIHRIADTLEAQLQERKLLFSHEGVGNLRMYIQATGRQLPYLVLLVDNFAPVYSLYPDLENFFIRLGREGGNYGILLVATVGTTMGLGYKLSQSIRTGVALQMKDNADYATVVGRTGGLMPEHLPGRGLFRDERVVEIQTALPAAMGAGGSYVAAIRHLGEQLQQQYHGRKASVVQAMPDEVAYGSMQAEHGGVVIGALTDSVKPLEIDLMEPHHLMISGRPGSGKSTTLQVLLQQMTEQYHARVALYGNTEIGMNIENVELLADGAACDRYLEELVGLLKERKAVYTADGSTNFEPICICIDGYKAFYDAIAQESVGRLKALLMIGKGLGVSLIAAENAQGWNTLAQYQETVTMLLAKGPAVLQGGKAAEHLAVETGLEQTARQTALKEHEGWYVQGGKAQRFRAMNSR